MAVLTGPVYVPAPNPVVPRYGIFNVATGPLDLPVPARQGGLNYQLSTCTLPNGYEVECKTDLGEKDFSGTVTTVTGSPFIIYSAVDCSPVGLANWGEEKVRQYLYQQLAAGEQATLERVFSENTFGVGTSLSGNASVVNLGSANGIVRGTAMLEQWLYERYGLPGVIHSPMFAAPYFSGSHIAYKDNDGVWKTDVTTKISFGNYAGEGPTGQVSATGSTWLYITGQVAIWRTPDSQLFNPPLGQIINRSTNLIQIVMEREYVITFDCWIAAVEVTLDDTSD
jgi:hypothetical protein